MKNSDKNTLSYQNKTTHNDTNSIEPQIQAKFNALESLNYALMDILSEAIFITDKNGKVTYINRQVRKILGYSLDEIQEIGTISDLLGQKKDSRSNLSSSEYIKDINLSVKDKSGKRHVLTVKIKKIADRNDSILYCCEDIPETGWRKSTISEYDSQRITRYDNNNLHVSYETFMESEQRFKTIFDNAADGILVADKKTRKFYAANRAICQMLGYSHKELTQLFVHDIHPPESLPAIIEAFDKMTRGKLKMVREIPVMRKNGDIFYSDISASWIQISGKKYIAGFFRDVTERKIAEEEIKKAHDNLDRKVKERTWELAEANRRLEDEIQERTRIEKMLKKEIEYRRLIIDSSPLMICCSDRQGRILFANKYIAQACGLSVDDMKERTIAQLHDREYADKFIADNQEVMSTGKAKREIVEKYSLATGEQRWALTNKIPYRDEKGTIMGVITFVMDITERKRAEEELKKSQQMLQLVLDTIPVRVFWKDRHSTYLGCNKLFARDAGLKLPDEIIGKNDFQLSWFQQAHLYRTDDSDVILKGETKLNYEEPQTWPDGTNLWLKTSKIPLKNLSGNIIGVLGCYEDITEKKHSEEQLKASLKEKDILLKEIHHRVKNNMQIISSLLNLQAMRIKDNTYQEFFDVCSDRINAMALVHEILYQSKDLSQINLKEYITYLTKNIFSSCNICGSTISLNLSLHDIFLGIDSAIPFGLVINELVTNSLKHAFSERKSGEISLSLYSYNDEIELIVRDNGKGLPEHLDINNIRSLGLRMVTSLVKKQLNGTLKIVRKTGKGTEFKIRFKDI